MMEQTEYTWEDRLRSFGIGIVIAVVVLAAAWGVIVIAWAASV